MIVVTGGYGFIGSNLVKGLNDLGLSQIFVVDDLTDGRKFKNLVDCRIQDYMDKEDFLAAIGSGHALTKTIKFIFHQGACSDTTQWNGQYMMKNNYDYSKVLLHLAMRQGIPFIYASSAAVYGAGRVFKEALPYECPLNMYGYSKFLFDQYVRECLPIAQSPIVGLRYFNVYGPNEFHKNNMASVALHHHQQVQQEGVVKLFEGCDGYGAGEQRRDFIYVSDVVKVNLWFMQHPEISGIFNVGTGQSQTFNEVGQAVIDWHRRGQIQYIPFPDHLKGRYQSFTQADISALRAVGYTETFLSVEQGVRCYLEAIDQKTEDR